MSRRSLLFLFLFALGVRLAFGWEHLLHPALSLTSDSGLLRRFALALSRGDFPSAYRTPGYPAYLWLLGGFPNHALWPALLVQMALDSLTSLLLALCAWQLTRQVAASLLSGLAWALCPVAILCSATVMTETLFVFFTSAALLLALQPIEPPSAIPNAKGAPLWERAIPNALAQGACWSAMLMVRLTGLPLLLLVTFFLLLRARFDRTRQAQAKAAGSSAEGATPIPMRGMMLRQLIALALCVACLGAWVAHNKMRTGLATLTTFTDVALYTYELPAAQMAQQVSWPTYARLWILSPPRAEKLRKQNEIRFLDEAFALPASARPVGLPKPRKLWALSENVRAVKWLGGVARERMAGRNAAMLGTHAVGMFQVLRPVPPNESGGPLFSALDLLRVLACGVVAVILARRGQWWLLGFLGLWIAMGLLMPGVCGVWRFRSFCEPAISLACGIALAPLALRLAPVQRAMECIQGAAGV